MAVAVGFQMLVDGDTRRGGVLPAAFERALSQTFVAFQPIVSWRDRAVYGFEALVRANGRPLGGAEELVRAAESAGSMRALGRTVRGAVAKVACSASDDAVLFVNVHADELLDPELAAPLSPLSLVAPRVVLELTEQATVGRGPELRERLAALRRLGYRIAVDDLGAGYSSLDLLAEIRPDFVKLDMSLVRRLDRDERRRRIVGHLLALLEDLGTKAVAEGVESAGERDALLDLGSPLLQGYLFGAPRPGLEQPRW